MTLPDSSSIQATHSSELKIAALPIQARKAHVFPQLKTSLISIPQLCDAGYKAIFDENKVDIVKDNKILLDGHRDKESNLYMIDLDRASKRQKTEKSIAQINNAYTSGPKKTLIEYYHKCICSLTIDTWCKAIDKGFFNTWPNLTSEAVRKHMTKSSATSKGYMNQQRQNIRSTKSKITYDHVPKEVQDPSKEKTQEHFYSIEEAGKTFSDQTGRFPHTSSKGNKYIMVWYHYDINAIITVALKTIRRGNK